MRSKIDFLAYVAEKQKEGSEPDFDLETIKKILFPYWVSVIQLVGEGSIPTYCSMCNRQFREHRETFYEFQSYDYSASLHTGHETIYCAKCLMKEVKRKAPEYVFNLL